ncbi:hypothetical protein [Lutispora saccharofermentans]|uniref:HEPN domain-containing protein n=1 Tax=Lutispora saccharofermentans TaxID=3024236 RepID=A0ABT1NHT5_9FIRM|nr:hypothetical protein [Lutispora saccharofermentans]MCQ1530789.1 hypothetical protein [Lutispora saccharofermentans]
MFPFTHIWFSQKVLGYSNNMTVLGAIFPDALVSATLNYEATHKIGWHILDYFYREKPELLDFIKSGITHTVYPRGLDFYGDEEYKGSKGFCFQKAIEIAEEVIDACNIPKEHGLWKAHNFIEMAVELNILSENNNLPMLLEDALKDTELIKEIEATLEKFYGLEPKSLGNSFIRFESFVYKKNVDSFILSINYDQHMKNKHGISIDIDKASKIIDKAAFIISKDYAEFFETTEKKVEEMLQKRLEL